MWKFLLWLPTNFLAAAKLAIFLPSSSEGMIEAMCILVVLWEFEEVFCEHKYILELEPLFQPTTIITKMLATASLSLGENK